MDSTTRAHIDHANKEEWTKKELATLSDEQKTRLVELVFHMNPEMRQLGPKSKNKWILILSGIYIRYLRGCLIEDYNTAAWEKRKKRLSSFDTSILQKQQ